MAEQNPLAKYQLQKAGNRRNTEGMFTNVNGNASRDARRAARREQRPMTFAEMQADGVARPGPLEMFTGPTASYEGLDDVGPIQTYVPSTDLTPEAPPTPTATPTPPIGDVPTSTPTPYGALRRAALANLESQFGAQRQSLEESLARRGLSASSYGAGMLGDLGGQQARALASLEANLLADEQARETQRNDLLLRLAQLFGL